MTQNRDPKVITYRIPQIEVYQVIDADLQRIKDSGDNVGQDLTFAVAALSVFVSFFIAIITATLTQTERVVFFSIEIFSFLVGIYNGRKWWLARKVIPEIIREIRSLKTEPQPDQTEP